LGTDRGAQKGAREEEIAPKSQPDPGADRNKVTSVGRSDGQVSAAKEDQPVRARPRTKPVVAEEDVQAVGEVVAWIQGGLKEFGFYDGPIDGRAGLRTQEAIRAYQRSRHLTPHGRINHALLVSLRRSLEEARGPTEERVLRRAERAR
jgi:peptidoglycan hydrolase-like protein with peptidoglycan-binding domain